MSLKYHANLVDSLDECFLHFFNSLACRFRLGDHFADFFMYCIFRLVYDSIYEANHKADTKVVLTLDAEAQKLFDEVNSGTRKKLNVCWKTNEPYNGSLSKKVRLFLRLAGILHTLYTEVGYRLDPNGAWKDLRGSTVVTKSTMNFAFNMVEYFHKEADILEKVSKITCIFQERRTG